MPTDPTCAANRFDARRAVAVVAVSLLWVGLSSCSSSGDDGQIAQSGNTTITTAAPGGGGTSTSTLPTGPACDEAAIADAFDASGQSSSTGVTNIRCVDTWAVANITTVDSGTTDSMNLFQANGLVWVAMGDVVPPDADTLHTLGVPTDVATKLLGGGND